MWALQEDFRGLLNKRFHSVVARVPEDFLVLRMYSGLHVKAHTRPCTTLTNTQQPREQFPKSRKSTC